MVGDKSRAVHRQVNHSNANWHNSSAAAVFSCPVTMTVSTPRLSVKGVNKDCNK